MKRIELVSGPLSFLAVSFLVVAGGCGAAQRSRDNLMDDIYAYNDGVRWHQYPKAAAHIHPRERSAFIAELSGMEDELKISDWELLNVDVHGKDGEAADVLVRYTWFMDSRGIVHDTSAVQTWKLFGHHWLVVGQKRVRGEPMPGIDEPEPPKNARDSGDLAALPGGAGGAPARVRPRLTQLHFEFR